MTDKQIPNERRLYEYKSVFTYTDNTTDDNDKTMENLHKQIIIDGVDVSGCKHYKNRTCIADYCLTDMPFGEAKCELNPNCHYKQFKRKEQECEELKNELHKNFKEKDTLHLIIDRLLEASGYDTNTASAEEFEDVYEHMRYEQQQLDQLKAENEDLKNRVAELSLFQLYKIQRDEAEKILTEIKEIAEKAAKCLYTTESDDYTDGYRWLGSLILQKIRKCEVENERILSEE